MGGIALAAALLGGALSVSVTPGKSSGSGTTNAPGPCPAVAAIVSGASSGITYSWTQLSGDPLTIAAPAASSTGFTFTGPIAAGGELSAIVRVTATVGAAPPVHFDFPVNYRDRRTV